MSGPRRTLGQRLRHPLAWGVLAVLGVVELPSVLHAPPHGAGGWYLLLSTPVLRLLLILWLAPQPWQGRPGGRAPGLVQGFLQAILVLGPSLLAFAWVQLALARSLGLPEEVGPPGGFLLNEVLHVGPAAVMVGGLIAYHDRVREERASMEAQARRAEIRLLQSRLQPHVLRRGLQGLASLLPSDPDAAEAGIAALAKLLRGLLRASECDVLPLGEERRLLDQFLAVESLCLRDRLRMRWEWGESLDELELPPLLLQPLVERGLRLGAPQPEGDREVQVAGRLDGDRLMLEVRVPATAEDGGTGLEGLRRRLQLAYGEGFRLEVSREGAMDLARLELPVSAG